MWQAEYLRTFQNARNQNVTVSSGSNVSFFMSGFIFSCMVTNACTYQNTMNQNVTIQAGRTVQFSESGFIISVN
jgi:hypothetical protein